MELIWQVFLGIEGIGLTIIIGIFLGAIKTEYRNWKKSPIYSVLWKSNSMDSTWQGLVLLL